MVFEGQGYSSLMKAGAKSFSGPENTIVKNAEAVKEIAEAIQSLYGPVVSKKLVINNLQKQFITSNVGTVLQEIGINHPALSIIHEAAQTQAVDYADNVTFTFMLYKELVAAAADLVMQGLATSDILAGYSEAVTYLMSNQSTFIDWTMTNPLDEKQWIQCLKGVISTKFYTGHESISATMSNAIVSCLKGLGSRGDLAALYSPSMLNMVPVRGGSAERSFSSPGFVTPIPPISHLKTCAAGSILVFNCPLECTDTYTKSKAVFTEASQLKDFHKANNEKLISQFSYLIENHNLKVVVGKGQTSNEVLEACDALGIVVLKFVSAFDIEKIVRSTGAMAIPQFDLDALKYSNFECLGTVSQIKILNTTAHTFYQIESLDTRLNSIISFANSDGSANELKPALQQAARFAKTVLKDPNFTTGAGNIEIRAYLSLIALAKTKSDLKHSAIEAFAYSLKAAAERLSKNLGFTGTDFSAPMIALLVEKNDSKDKNVGFNMQATTKQNLLRSSPAFDHLGAKFSAIRLAFESACTIISVDQMIIARPSGGPPTQTKGRGSDGRDATQPN